MGAVRAARSKTFVGVSALLGVLAVVAVGWWFLRPLRGGVEGSATIRSVAVLPLANLMGGPQQMHFVDGLHDVLIGELARIDDLTVISRTSVLRYRDTEKRSGEIAAELGVDALVEGTVFRAGDSVRIQVQLIRGSPEEHLWSERYDGRLSQALALQSRVALAIADEIELVLSPEDAARLATEREVNPAAQEAYYRGRALWRTRSGDGLRRAVPYLEEAVLLDSTFALAWAGLADAYIMGWNYRALELTRQETFGRAEESAMRALELDAELAEAHAALAKIRHLSEWDLEGAEALMRRAIDLNPNYAQAHNWLGDILGSGGRLQEALAARQKARELDPFSPLMNRDVGDVLVHLGRCDEAMEFARTALELDPEHAVAYRVQRDCHILAGRYDEAVEAEVLVWRAVGAGPDELQQRRQAYEHGGWTGFLEHGVETVRTRLAAGERISYYGLAYRYALLGKRDEAFQALERSLEARELGPLLSLMSDPFLEPLRSDPRWEELVRRAGF